MARTISKVGSHLPKDEPKLRKTLLATEMEKSVSVNYVVPKVTS